MGNFYDHPVKRTIREKWCKPLLQHLFKCLGYKLVYLGLPGVEALDIASWIAFLHKIIAFECGNYANPSDQIIAKRNISILNDRLSKLERAGRITNYSLYHGFIEEVVLREFDNSGNSFSVKDLITIYNLDFCNSLTVPIQIIDRQGNPSKHYKMEVIHKLLKIQDQLQNASTNPVKFIMFLTVNAQFWEDEARRLKSTYRSPIYTKHIRSFSRLPPTEKLTHLLKLYTFFKLEDLFYSCHFIPDFLPPIYYKGTGRNWLVCFTIMGTHIQQSSKSTFLNSNMDTLLSSNFISANSSNIFNLDSPFEFDTAPSTDPVLFMQQTQTYKNHWVQRR